jgi:tRNA pseudouridine38-40 synthase
MIEADSADVRPSAVTNQEAENPVPGARRWRLDIAYDGAEFSGWAAQPGRRTVQGSLENCVTQVLRLPAPVRLVCAGRTDAGVHARGQVAHLDLDEMVLTGDGEVLMRRLLQVLPGDLVVKSASPAPAGFHARFAAIWRRYVYRLCDVTSPPDPLSRNQLAVLRHAVDLEAMNQAGAALVGLRDFSAFCRNRGGGTSIRTLLELTGSRLSSGPMAGTIEFTVRADAFCHSMVRTLIGALVAVGSGRRDADWLARVAHAGVRDPAAVVMPARGLTLEEVCYPPDRQLAMRVRQARSVRDPLNG